MTSRTKLFSNVLLLIGVFHSFLPMDVSAQGPGSDSSAKPGVDVTIVQGTVTFKQGSIIRVLGSRIAVDISQAEITSITDQPLTEEVVTVGLPVTCYGGRVTSPDPDTPIKPFVLQVQLPNEGQIAGVVQSVDPVNQTLMVSGQLIKITDKTYIRKNRLGKRGKLSDIKVGSTYGILVRIENDGFWAAVVSSLKIRAFTTSP